MKNCERLPLLQRATDNGQRVPWRSAYTLIELVAVLAIFGMLAVIAIPRVAHFGEGAKVAAAARAVASAVGRAQIAAAAAGVPATVIYDLDRQRVGIDVISLEPGEDAPRETHYRMRRLPADVEILAVFGPDGKAVDGPEARFAADPMGVVEAHTVQLALGRRFVTIMVHPLTGRAEIFDELVSPRVHSMDAPDEGGDAAPTETIGGGR